MRAIRSRELVFEALAGFQVDIFGAMMEHPPAVSGGSTLPAGREPADVAPQAPRFQQMSLPGYNMKPVQRYEERALRLWGSEEVEEQWDPVRLGLAYIDLTAACDLPLQVAMCFITAALWFWRALELLGDNCGGDGWLEMYIFEDIWAAPANSKRLAMQYALKRLALGSRITFGSRSREFNKFNRMPLRIYKIMSI